MNFWGRCVECALPGALAEDGIGKRDPGRFESQHVVLGGGGWAAALMHVRDN